MFHNAQYITAFQKPLSNFEQCYSFEFSRNRKLIAIEANYEYDQKDFFFIFMMEKGFTKPSH